MNEKSYLCSVKTYKMKRYILLTAFFLEVLYLHAANDPRCLSLMGMAFEGPVDSVRQQLTANGFSEWGQSDDGEDIYFRGNFYGIRAKLLVSKNSETNLVTSAYVTIGPYGTEAMLTKNINISSTNYKKIMVNTPNATTPISLWTTLVALNWLLPTTSTDHARFESPISLMHHTIRMH